MSLPGNHFFDQPSQSPERFNMGNSKEGNDMGGLLKTWMANIIISLIPVVG